MLIVPSLTPRPACFISKCVFFVASIDPSSSTIPLSPLLSNRRSASSRSWPHVRTTSRQRQGSARATSKQHTRQHQDSVNPTARQRHENPIRGQLQHNVKDNATTKLRQSHQNVTTTSRQRQDTKYHFNRQDDANQTHSSRFSLAPACRACSFSSRFVESGADLAFSTRPTTSEY